MSTIQDGNWVVSTNALHADNGVGVVQQVRGEQAKVEFRPTVFSKPPYLTLSRTLSLNDLRVVRSPLERLRDGEFDEPWRFDLRTRAAQLLVCNRDGQLGDARTDLLPHQISVAHRVVSSPRRRYLIADEVGLGKTIEAGMILYALRQRGQARRVLIVPPAGLTLQWQEEMEDKFDLKFAVYREDVDGPLAFDQMDYLIASVDTLKLDRLLKGGRREGHKTMLLGSRDWDVIIFDEAHKLSAKTWSPQKTEKTLNYRLAEDLQERCRALILLTATPHQGDESKFQNLVSLLHPDVTFEESATAGDEDGLIPFTDLILRNRKSKVTDADGNPIFKGMDIHPVRVALLDNGERQFDKALESYLREGYGFADQDPGDKQHKAIGFVMTTFQKLAASSTRAIKAALQKRLVNLQATVQAEENQDEAEYDARHQGEFEARKAGQVRQAFIETEVEMLEKLLAVNVPGDAKQSELSKVIESVSRDAPDQLVLIFTEYLATQDFLIELLEHAHGEGCTARIRGGMTMWEKKKSIAAFRDNPKVRFLVSTEAGGEGINLQFAHVMINYDLPWNPFRLAQRYGRLYRYGQDKRVQVFNFQNAGTIEDRVREYLEQKTRAAAGRLSGLTGETPEEIEEGLLGLFEEYLNYEKIYREGLTKGNIKPSQKEIDEAVKKAEESYKIAYASLFSKDIAPFNPERFRCEVQSPLTLEDVKAFVLEFVKREGRKVTESGDGMFEFLLPDSLKGVKGLERRYVKVTFDRAIAIRNSEAEFMAIGHPFTNAVLKRCGSFDFGGLASSKAVRRSPLVSGNGALFNFTVKVTKAVADGESVFFEFIPAFVRDDGTVEPKAADAIVSAPAEANMPSKETALLANAESLFEKAKGEVLAQCAQYQPWDEDVFCLNALRIQVT
ncbi:MAG: DEAD/DEAH box helicase family protein [Planctomycetes bacterium]|nr:DEAD/DEAH box helicase family protein [Planctomycetota bacterium]MCG2683483.1 SNF2-related protein [Planctomycetales bacterium]